MSEARFGSWSASQSPVTIEYSLVAIEEIRQEVSEGFQRLSRGGVEVGGILYGSRDGRTIRVTAIRPIACEHARGPAFQLSDSDVAMLAEQLECEPDDPRLTGLICVGWFISHTRSGISLTEQDQEIYSKYFGAPWQVSLVIRPGRGGSMRAGFFVREEDGTVHAESSYEEFNFPDRLAGVLERSARGESRVGHRLRPTPMRPRADFVREGAGRGSSTAPLHQEYAQELTIQAPRLLPPRTVRPKWPAVAIVTAVVLIAALLGLRYWMLASRQEPLLLTVAERDGQLQIDWNGKAAPVASAARGSLSVTDGQTTRTFPLSSRELGMGNYTYKRSSETVEVRLNVESSNGNKATETTTFLGAAEDEKTKAILKERDDLKAQVDALTKQNADQADRIQQLERNLKVLQARLGIQ